MTRVSLTQDYDDRSVIAKLKKMDEKLDANAGIVTRAEESARASADAAQHTADRFAGSVGAVVSDAKDEIAAAKAEVDQTVTTVAQAVTTANAASASAQQSAQTVQTYEDRLQRAEVGIQTLDGETADLYARDAMNLRSNEPNQTAQGLRIGTHDLSKAVTTDEAQTIGGAKTFISPPAVSTITRPQFVVQAGGGVYSEIELRNGNGARKLTFDGADILVADPTTGANSATIVNKAYVESTDGATNNLVHRTSTETIEGNKRFATPPTMVGPAGGFRSYTQFTDADRTAVGDARRCVHSVLDKSNRELMNVEHGTDTDGARDYITVSCCGTGARDGKVAQLRLNFTNAGVTLQVFDPVNSVWKSAVLQ